MSRVAQFCRAGALLVAGALALLLHAYPAPVWAVGGFHVTPHSTPHGARPKAPAHEGAGAHGGAGGKAAQDSTWVDPPLLRDAPPVGESPPGGDAQPGPSAAGDGPVLRPFPTAPNIEVVLTSDPARDAQNLQRLRAELSGRVDPDRVRILSLADDALSDSRLAAGLGTAALGPQAAVAAELRQLQGDVDVQTLARVLRHLNGDVLLLVAHHEPDGTVVFAGRKGQPVRAAAAVLQQAAEQAGLHLQLLGCHSARWSAAGYRDTLNSLDAVEALLKVHQGRPRTWLDLMAILSGPERPFRVHADRWQDQRQAEVLGPDGATPVSGFKWYGPRVAAPPAVAEPAGATARPDKASTFAWLAAVLLASIVAGEFLAPWAVPAGAPGQAATRGVWRVNLLHGAVVAVWMGVWARAVAGEGSLAWAVGGLLAAASALLWAAWRVWQGRGAGTGLRWLHLVRAAALAAPLALLVLLHGGVSRPPAPVLAVMRALHAWAWDQREPKQLGTLALLVAAFGLAATLVASLLGNAVFARWHPWRYAAHSWRLLADMGVASLWRRWAAVRTRVHLESAMWRQTPVPPAWAQLQVKAHFDAPDPWRGGQVCRWQLVQLPLGQDDAAHALVRADHPFVHGLPSVLAQRQQRGQLSVYQLPGLLAEREWWLRGTDFVPVRYSMAPVLAGALVVFAASVLAMDAWVLPQYMRGQLTGVVGVTLALALWPLLLIAQRAMHRTLLQQAGRDDPARFRSPA